ncbi:glycosyltransferase [Nocardia cyriacigeorgica]|uniref:glycosyltransferase n=1 Tax=Nocardia cyriacigeorgica TaxID=135487 RepID=UPI001894F53C|nr:glycosyltransferase [Nocardia cyriacigeorgica]MBF6440344.1 glycosyltransferase family 1 protein [Nocardia cyriacigeorgica]
MARYLLCATPAGGHVHPVLDVAGGLRQRGHDVTVLTGSRFRSAVEEAGIAFRSLTGAADINDREPDSFLPDRGRYRGLRLARYQLRRMFIDPIPAQAKDVADAVRDIAADAVIVDSMFLGALPMLHRPERPPVVALGVSPLSMPGPEVPPYTSGLIPVAGAFGRIRNRALNAAMMAAFKGLERAVDEAVRSVSGQGLDGGLFGIARHYDRYLQLGPAEFEYPRGDLPAGFRFAGPLGLDRTRPSTDLPQWWPELDGRRVVHVTQGTAANADPSALIRPTIDALAGTDLLVVVSTGGEPVERLGRLPRNVRAEQFIPHTALFAHVDAFVTNGGYGAVTNALCHGIPIVIAPGGEDKREVAAHVRYFDVGINLRRERPPAEAIRAAVHRVLDEPRHRDAARAIAQACGRYRPHDIIADELRAAVSERRTSRLG